MNEVERAIREAAVKYEAFSPEQVVHILRYVVTDPEEADAIVKSMRDDRDTYGGLFLARVV